jgi:hypothetical protein
MSKLYSVTTFESYRRKIANNCALGTIKNFLRYTFGGKWSDYFDKKRPTCWPFLRWILGDFFEKNAQILRAIFSTENFAQMAKLSSIWSHWNWIGLIGLLRESCRQRQTDSVYEWTPRLLSQLGATPTKLTRRHAHFSNRSLDDMSVDIVIIFK